MNTTRPNPRPAWLRFIIITALAAFTITMARAAEPQAAGHATRRR